MEKRGGRMMPSLRRALIILPVWILCSIRMWSWWFSSDRVNSLPLFVILSLALLYEFLILPSTFLYFVIKAKNPPRRIAQKGKKVAVISLCVPSSESVDIVEKQLIAMTEIEYPHDSWILDEGGDPEIKRLAKKYKVHYFTRKGIEKYNQQIPPFMAKTKAGNVNAWLEHVKRKKYDYFVQFDIDHIADPKYLNKTLGYFRDEQIAWVQAPSVYGNLEHWTSRGAAEQELVLQGPLQMGFYGFSKTPFIIGSHCTYRMSAIREIGGFQPTRAEDHLDTVMMASLGYRGVFIPEVIAVGDGPETLNTYLSQQYAWAYSMFQVLLHHTPKLIKSMNLRQKLIFLFAETWYPFWTLSYLIMFMSPIIALLLGKDIARVVGDEFGTHFLPIFVTSFLVWWAARPLMHPQKVGLSWRGMILHVVRWPIVLRAIIAATFRIKKPYMITPKGSFAQLAPTLQTYKIFLGFGLLSASSVILGSLLHGSRTPSGQVVFALANTYLMAFVCVVDLDLRLRKAGIAIRNIAEVWIKPISGVATLVSVATIAVMINPLLRSSAYDGPELKTQNSYRTVHEFRQDYCGKNIVPELGVYSKRLVDNELNLNGPFINHVFASWNDVQYIEREVNNNQQDDNTLLITIEPRDRVADGSELLNRIIHGYYDTRILDIAKIAKNSCKNIYLRFAHEMELSNLYLWGDQNPELYKKSFRHAVSLFKSVGANNVKWVWSPAGNYGAEQYYPGDDVVDVIGVTVLYDQYWYGKTYVTFEELSASRRRLLVLNKPIWIVEFGVGRANYGVQKKLIKETLESYRDLGFDKLIYLSMKDANITGPDYSLDRFDMLGKQFEPSLPHITKHAINLNNPAEKLNDQIFSNLK